VPLGFHLGESESELSLSPPTVKIPSGNPSLFREFVGRRDGLFDPVRSDVLGTLSFVLETCSLVVGSLGNGFSTSALAIRGFEYVD
jgi:hypothetical protein